LGARYINTLKAQKVEDPVALEEEARVTNVWSDMEKCIFFDRFLQHPKDFRKIASFLRNKTTRDCVAFYYDSKQTVPYKAALKEHLMRRKRRGDYQIWDATIQAALSLGAVITAGPSEQKPLIFTLPENDGTYFTFDLHPLQREIFDKATLEVEDMDLEDFDEEDLEAPVRYKGGKLSQRYKKEPFFNLAKEEKKWLKSKTKAPPAAPSGKDATSLPKIPLKKAKLRASLEEAAEKEAKEAAAAAAAAVPPPAPPSSTPGEAERAIPRKAPQKWSAAERKVFVETLEKHGTFQPLVPPRYYSLSVVPPR